jgi:hypothetical protein
MLSTAAVHTRSQGRGGIHINRQWLLADRGNVVLVQAWTGAQGSRWFYASRMYRIQANRSGYVVSSKLRPPLSPKSVSGGTEIKAILLWDFNRRYKANIRRLYKFHDGKILASSVQHFPVITHTNNKTNTDNLCVFFTKTHSEWKTKTWRPTPLLSDHFRFSLFAQSFSVKPRGKHCNWNFYNSAVKLQGDWWRMCCQGDRVFCIFTDRRTRIKVGPAPICTAKHHHVYAACGCSNVRCYCVYQVA